ncbi:unnamed protein product [Ixodes hexagonus]
MEDGSEESLPEASPGLCNGPWSFTNICGSDAYPMRPLVADDPSLAVPFPCLPGEGCEFLGRTTQGSVALSSYRLFLSGPDQHLNLPLGLLESVECRDIFYLHLNCKDARSFRCSFATNEDCQRWHRRLSGALQVPKRLDDLFAFRFFSYCREERFNDLYTLLKNDKPYSDKRDSSLLYQECKRMGFDTDGDGIWKISSINETFKFCQSYPRYFLVPASVQDQDLEAVASFRYSRRIPTVVWRHHLYGTVIARSAQPEVGWLGWRSPQDENLIQAIADACSVDPGPAIGGLEGLTDDHKFDSDPSDLSLLSNGITSSGSAPQRKMLILDARSYAAAVANRAKGGGCECPEYYPNCEVQFMSLANIHTIRKSFHMVRTLCSSAADQSSWMSTLESSKWLLYLSGLLKASLVVANAVDLERRPVLVHCSDGWDRTPQIVALAELMLDPYYRTTEGFEVLVEKEWLEFGHKFGDRCGNSVSAEDVSERCPVFLQWLDCVHQLLAQFPCSFQFNQQYLASDVCVPHCVLQVKLAQHTYSCLFGNFLGNSVMERQREGVAERTFSVWCFLRARPEQFRNYLYSHTDQVLRPQSQVRDLRFWSEVYLPPAPCASALSGAPPATPPSESQEAAEETPPEPAAEPSPQTNLAKTKSVDSLYAGPDTQATAPDRRVRFLFPSKSLISLRCLDASPTGVFTAPMVSVRRAACQASPSKQSCPDLASEPSLRETPAAVPVGGARDDAEAREEPANEAPSIDGSTDTLVNEAGQLSSSAGAQDNGPQVRGRNGALAHLLAQSAQRTEPELPEQQLSNTASTSTTDLRSAAGAAPGGGGYSELLPEEVAPGKCVLCLSRKNGHESLLAATRSSLARSAAAVSNGGRFSHYSTPMHSRTPSSGFPATPCDDRLLLDPMASRGQSSQASCQQQQQFDVDGLNTPMDALQQRIHQMVLDHEAKIENLENELRRARFALDQRSLHHNGKEASDALEDALGLDCACSGEPPWGGCQDGSSSSELSWEQVDERDARATLWVPDHAASHCTACGAEFWIGRRKHHCRNCGNVFCSQCASQMHPVPHEQLYQPVRVCSLCFEALRSRPCRPSALLAAPGPHPERILAKTSPAVTAASN